MKLTTIIGSAIAAVGLAACGSTAAAPTARPTVAPTVAPTSAPTSAPTAAPTATPTPAPGVTVTVTCSNVLDLGQFAATGYPPGSILGTPTWHGVKVGYSLQFGSDPQPIPITSNPFTAGSALSVEFGYSFTQGTWYWDEVTQPPAYVEVAHGTLTIPACPGKTIR
jgi:hypothetical protein